MPSVAQEQHLLLSSGKKRRRDEQDADMQLHLYEPILPPATSRSVPSSQPDHPSSNRHPHRYQSPGLITSIKSNDAPLYHTHHTYHAQQGASPRKILPFAKRLRLVEERDYTYDQEHDRHSHSPTSRRARTPEAATAALQQTNANSRPQLTRSTTSVALLAPCHICHRRPTRKSDLDSFAHCEGCEQRTCYVCMRKCLGWRPGHEDGDLPPVEATTEDNDDEASRFFHMEDAPDENGHSDQALPQQRQAEHQHREKPGWAGGHGGHRQMVCSRCCMERGPDGDVVCLGCLPFVEA